MQLLGSVLYDPAGAVTKNTTTALAMTAIDTTNLRLAITVPAHGQVKFRVMALITGAATYPAVLLGVLSGATVTGRVNPCFTVPGNLTATGYANIEANFIKTGLTVGANNYDAAYGVETGVASTAIKYGGPNDTTANNAWGAIIFEAWDPAPFPTNSALMTINSGGGVLLSATQTGVTIPTVTTVTNQLTAAAIATGVWQDATAGDFTTASSIGKALYVSNVAPGGAGGHFIAGTNAQTTITTGLTTTFSGSLTGSVATLTTLPAAPANWLSASSVSANAVSAIQSGLATPTNITSASGVSLSASQAGVTIGTVTTLTNLPNAPANWLSASSVSASAVTAIQSGLATPTNITSASGVSLSASQAGVTIGTVTTLTNLPAAPANWLSASSVSANAVTAIQAGLATPTNITSASGVKISGTTMTLDALTTHGDTSWATATGFATPTNITSAAGVSLAASQHVIVDSGTVTTATSVTNVVSANITKVNGVAVNGDGAATPWGP